jgi:hypothetical protein
MSFEEGALARLRRYREEADRSLGLMREAEEIALGFSGRLLGSLEYMARLAREAGFHVESDRREGFLDMVVAAGRDAQARAVFGVLRGTAAETDESLLHEELSHYLLLPSGYSGRILGFCAATGEEPCQVFAIYRDGVWRTSGLLAERARGRVDDPEEVLNGFSLRMLGRLIDLAAPTGGSGRRWSRGPYTLEDLLRGREFPTETRWLR